MSAYEHAALDNHARSSPPRRPVRPALEDGIPEGDAVDRQVRARESAYRRCLAIADVLAASIALVVCLNVLGSGRVQLVALLGLPLIVGAGRAHGLYDRDEHVVNKSTMDEAPQLFQCATLYTLLVVLLQSPFVHGSLRAQQIVALWGSLFAASLVARRLARYVAGRLTKPERILFVGANQSYQRLASKLHASRCRVTLVGRVPLESLPGDEADGSATGTLHRLLADRQVHRVVVEPSEAAPQATLDFVREAKTTGVRVSLLPRILEVVGSTIKIDDVDGLTLLGVRRLGLTRSSRIVKRAFDATAAGLGLLALAPALLVLALLIKRDTPGPALFRQRRVGRGGQSFEMLKFRTMVANADQAKAALQEQVDPASGLFKIPDDPRITRVGRWLRRSSLDELPQLVNVLRGQMSLVGPRPLIADEDSRIVGHDRCRLHLTPGMTGHWQIQGSRVPMAEMVKLDYLYVAGWSLWGDLKILLRTGLHVLAWRGM